MYYATVMVLTTAATVTGVLILSIHHKGREGVLVPPHLRRVARWVITLHAAARVTLRCSGPWQSSPAAPTPRWTGSWTTSTRGCTGE